MIYHCSSVIKLCKVNQVNGKSLNRVSLYCVERLSVFLCKQASRDKIQCDEINRNKKDLKNRLYKTQFIFKGSFAL